jgi:hypothetical protein
MVGPGIAEISAMRIRSRWFVWAAVTVSAVGGWIVVAGSARSEGFNGAGPEAARPSPTVTREMRDLALKNAKVWHPTDVASFDFGSNPPDPSGALSEPVVPCRYLPEAPDGTTPKFDCVLRDGEVVKVKYGRFAGESFAEIAASRLLTALGFAADRMYWVPRIRCEGCPPFPFHTMWLLDRLHARKAIAPRLVTGRTADFEWAAVERKHEGETIKSADQKGWGWFELDQINPGRGATRAEVDALRLAALLLAHWDNKSTNQRLVCLDTQPLDANRPCARPLAMIQDLGSTFGPKKVDLAHWRATPIWRDPARCIVTMRQMPYGGGTFPDTQISETGRQLIARQLSALTERQVLTLFSAARFRDFNGRTEVAGDPNAWALLFRDKVRQIAEAGPCPS